MRLSACQLDFGQADSRAAGMHEGALNGAATGIEMYSRSFVNPH
jgi:hypothetical protein